MAENPEENKSQDAAQGKLLETARERFKLCAEAETDLRRDALDDLKFRAGEQWPDEVRRERELDQRPCLVINRIPQFIRQITNDQRQNRPSIKVFPVDDVADIDTAKVYQGIIRHIEYSSQADTAYDTAFDCAVTSGLGYFRIVTDWVDSSSFDQEILIKRIRNPFSVYKDPSSSEPDGSDMNFCFIVEDLTKEEYKTQFPDTEMASLTDFSSIGDHAADWLPDGRVRVAEYFYKESKEVELLLLRDGQIIESTAAPEGMPKEFIAKKRKAMVPVIKWCKLNAAEILEEREWIGEWIPVIPVIGEELEVDGKLILKGIVRDAKDPQRMYNYWKSSETETIALAPRVPFIGAEGQFKGHEAKWKTAHKKNHAYLEYNPASHTGQLLPPPQRQAFEPAIQAITMAGREASEDIKATTGIYDAALGARSNETSGVAIARRNQQAQTSNFHFVDNLSRSLRHAGRILVDLIPKIYDTPRAARIIGEDGEQEVIRINEIFEHKGKKRVYSLGHGKYDVISDTGPSYASKRQEAADSMLELSKVAPQIMQVAPDIVVKALDLTNSAELAERLKKTLPPGIADQENSPIPPQLKAQMDQMGQMVDQLTAQLNDANQKLETKSIELESKERIAAQEQQTKLQIELAKIDALDAREIFRAEIAQLEQRLNMLGQNEPIQTEFGSPQDELPQPTGGPSPGNPMEGMP